MKELAILTQQGKKFLCSNFWFCRNAGLSLPPIALQYHEVKIILTHNLEQVLWQCKTNTLYKNKNLIRYR